MNNFKDTMKRSLLLLTLLAAILFAACESSSETPTPDPDGDTTKVEITFSSEISDESSFETGDAIGVFATKSSGDVYAENVKYVCGSSGQFTSTSPIYCDEYTGDLVYSAIYPYTTIYGNGSFSFSVNTDQSTEAGYTASQLLGAVTAASSESNTKLSFEYKMAAVQVNFDSEVISIADASVVFTALCDVDCNALTSEYIGVGEVESITPYELSESSHIAMVAPQSISAGSSLAEIVVAGESYSWILDEALELESGKIYSCTITIENGVVTFESNIDSWGDGGELGGGILGDDSEEDDDTSFIKMVEVTGGTFTMGNEYNGYSYELPLHSVTLSSYYIARYELSQAQWYKVMGYNNSYNSSSSLYPAELISWLEAIEFCNALSVLEGYEECYTISGSTVTADYTKKGYRLPTEAEWEFAARGGNSSLGYKYSGSNDVEDVGYYRDNATSTQEVGSKKANELGLYNMSGNVSEWCWDWFSTVYYSESPSSNPMGPDASYGLTEDMHVVRGGSYISYYDSLYVGSRNCDYSEGSRATGIRLARTL